MEQINEANIQALIARADSLGGPRIAGKVEVSLESIDQIRADYVFAVKAYRELAQHVKEVRVVLVPGDGSGNKFVKTKDLKETITYKNLDEFREIIAAEEREKLKSQFDLVNAGLDKAREETTAAIQVQNDLKETIQSNSKYHTEQVRKLKQTIKENELVIQDNATVIKEFTEEMEKLTTEKNTSVTELEKLKEQFNDISKKFVEEQERPKAPKWLIALHKLAYGK
jgi:chromosome segregation ATPase